MNIFELILLGVSILVISTAIGVISSALGYRFGKKLSERKGEKA